MFILLFDWKNFSLTAQRHFCYIKKALKMEGHRVPQRGLMSLSQLLILGYQPDKKQTFQSSNSSASVGFVSRHDERLGNV
jgi:hypothetical protein